MKTVLAKKKTAHKALRNGANGTSAHQLVRKVENGLKFRQLESLRAQLGLPLDKVGEKLGISRATLHRRKAAGRLEPDESDKVVRFEQLFKHAKQVFGDDEGARLWLNFPQWGLGGAVPLDYARTETGARQVDNLLGQIEYGVFS
ncbi:MAG: type II RES/Xre toxin-antitoxin system antitoxin [Chthoniobacterales bacterium]